MDVIQVFLRTTLYIASLLAIGHLLKSSGLLENSENALFKYVMYVAMPALAIDSLSGVGLNQELLMALLIYLLSMFLTSSMILLAGVIAGLERSETYLLILAANFSNTGFFGIPFMSVVFGEAVLKLSIVLWMATFIYSSFLCIPLLESLRGSSQGIGVVASRTLKNPLTISVTLGLLLSFSKVSVPTEISFTLKSLGSTASPLALISIGASMRFSKSASLRTQAVLIFLRSLLSPLISLILGLIARLSYMELSTLVLMSAMPAAIFLGVFSNEYDFHREEVFTFITISSLTAPLYLNAWLYTLNFAFS